MSAHGMSMRAAVAGPSMVVLALALAAGLITATLLGPELARLQAPAEGYDVERMVLLYSSLPRVATALICGAALALSGTILQQVLRNPLASPTTLGISAGANLALALATLLAPWLLGFGRDLVALAGAGGAACLVFGLVVRRGFSPFSLILAGLIVSLYCGALASILVLMNDGYLVSLFIWGGGSLAQQDWSIPVSLLPRVGILVVLAGAMVRPFALLDLENAGASALGLSTSAVRISGVVIAVLLSGFVVSAVGVIGFIGLLAPAIARLAGARRFQDQLIWSPLIGAMLLWFTDQAVQALAGAASAFVPTGAVTALFGTPLLLLLLPRLKSAMRPLARSRPGTERIAANASLPLSLLAIALLILLTVGILLGRSPDGAWALLPATDWPSALPFRAPRVAAALFAGAMLAVAGTILQRLTGNEMASPEVLGISAGATIGVAMALFVLPTSSYGGHVAFAAGGACLVLVMIYVLGRKEGFAPERVLLAGIALGALLDALVGALSASGDPRALQLLRWMSGSTYTVDWAMAAATAAFGLPLILLALLARRWLDLMPLGPVASAALGVDVRRVRLLLFLLAAALSAAATLVLGPLSFVGLLAPHIARELGLHRAWPQMLGAALAGGAIMVSADWAGRMIAFPYQMPAGLVSALVGAPFLMLLLRRAGQ